MIRRKNSYHPHPTQRVIDFGFADDQPAQAPKVPTPRPLPYPLKEHTEEQKRPISSGIFKFMSLGSGSSGNCSYIGNERGGILVDAGVKPDYVEDQLRASGISMAEVKGILLTHDHSDHIQYVYRLLRAHKHLVLFCTNRVLNGLLSRHNISKRIRDYHTAIYKEIPFKILDFEITAFEVPHDGSDNMGFSIVQGDRHFVLATDMGAVSARAYHYIQQAHFLVVEANYDLTMLRNGRYPEYLKARIQTQYGHMDNTSTGALLSRVAGNGLKYVWLCHLSRDNNTPEKALSTVRATLEQSGFNVGTDAETLADLRADLILTCLPRFDATRLYVLR